ncbi:helix-turn-helix domain-containing protein [Rhodococcus cerastii]|nr:helix-turn-helix domain-containing protein [Rhodococcus cerastii]
MSYVVCPISSRYLSHDERIEIADGLAREEPVKAIAERIGKSFQSVYREIARNRTPDGRYPLWYAHNQHTSVDDARKRGYSPVRRCCAGSSPTSSARGGHLDSAAGGCDDATPAAQSGTCAWRRSTKRCIADWSWPHGGSLRTGRTYRRRRGRGRSRDGSLKQSTNLTPIAQRPAHVQSRRQIGTWRATSSLARAGDPRDRDARRAHDTCDDSGRDPRWSLRADRRGCSPRALDADAPRAGSVADLGFSY